MGHRVIASPLGELTLVGEGETVCGLYYPGHRPAPDRAAFGALAPSALRAAERQLGEYLAGARDVFELDTALVGTPFQRAVWARIAAIPRGETRSYRELADELSRELSGGLSAPAHPRAVGGAVARNPLSVIVPCHRVVGAAGALTGYAGGLERKRALLELEGAAVVAPGSGHGRRCGQPARA